MKRLHIPIILLAAAAMAVMPACRADLNAPGSRHLLRKVADIPLPGSPSRFDYQSLDPKTGLLYISHMGAGEIVAFNTKTGKVATVLKGFPRVTGILAVPELHRLYASLSSANQVEVVDTRNFRVLARVQSGDFPDGIAYAPPVHRIFVSNESGQTETVIDTRTNWRVALIPMGGEVGNTRYDPVTHLVLATVQTRNQLVAIDPETDKIVQRYNLKGGLHPHGLLLDATHRLAFVACDGDARLLVMDLRNFRVARIYRVGDEPDVLAFDPSLRWLYVGCESGIVSLFKEKGGELKKAGDVRVDSNAHSVSVNPFTHLLYIPLEDVKGRPALRVMTPL